jgi:hypothetical protein
MDGLVGYEKPWTSLIADDLGGGGCDMGTGGQT